MYQEVLFNTFQSRKNSESIKKEHKSYSKGYEEKVTFGDFFNFSIHRYPKEDEKMKRTIAW